MAVKRRDRKGNTTTTQLKGLKFGCILISFKERTMD